MFGFAMHWIYAHLIGDYILQNDWMAANKKKHWLPALVHVLTYMIPFLFTAFPWWALVLIAAQHFVLDKTNIVLWFMRAKGSAQFTEPPYGPWSVCIVDNILHILWMALLAEICFG